MKNITVFLVLVIISFPVFGESALKGYSFSVAPHIGFVYGQALELVYQNPSLNDSEFLSELKWDMKPIFYMGLGLDFGITDIMKKPGFFSTVSFKAGIPADSGYIENRDWLSNAHSELTDYSKHTNKTRDFFWLDAAIGVSIPIGSISYIKTFINGSWMHFAFTGRDGYGEYPYSSDPDFHYIDYTGQDIITYKQDWFLAAIGFTIGTEIFHPLSIELTFRASPFTYCIAMDEHLSVLLPDGRHTNKRTYNDYTRFGLYIEPGCTISFTLQKIDLSLGINYRYIGNTRGVTYINNSPYPDTRNESGAGLFVLDTKLIVTIRL